MRQARRGSPKFGRVVILGLGLLLLGIPALRTLRVGGLPRWGPPELTIALQTAELLEPRSLVESWGIEIESRIRSVGDVLGITSYADRQSLLIQARFPARAALELKAAQVSAALEGVRQRLPPSARLTPVDPRARGDLTAMLWLGPAVGEPASEKLVSSLRKLPGVVRVEEVGRPFPRRRVQVLEPPSGAALDRAAAIAQAARFTGARHYVRVRESRSIPPIRLGSGSDLADTAIGSDRDGTPVQLAAVATVETERAAPDVEVRQNGAAAFVLLVYRSSGTSPIALADEVLRIASAAEEVRVGWLEGQPVGRLLLLLVAVLAAGLGIATLWAVARCGKRGLWFPFLALAGASAGLVGLSQVGREIDTAMLAGALSALLAGWALTWHRLTNRRARGWQPAVLALVALTCALGAIRFASDALTSQWLPAALAAWVMLAGILAASCLLPAGLLSYPMTRTERRLSLFGLRDPGAALLILGATSLALLGLCLYSVRPVTARLAYLPGDLIVSLATPEAERSSTRERLARLEGVLSAQPEVESHWSVLNSSSARVFVKLRGGASSPADWRELVSRLGYLTVGIGSVEFEEPRDFSAGFAALAAGNASPLAASTDSSARGLKAVLRATVYADLVRARRQVRERLRGLHDLGLSVEPPGGTDEDLRLVPRASVARTDLLATSALVRWATTEQRVRVTGSAREIVLSSPLAGRDRLPDLEDVLGLNLGADQSGQPRTVGDLFEARRSQHERGLYRENGRYAEAIEVRFTRFLRADRQAARDLVRQALLDLPLPPSSRLDLPAESPEAASAGRSPTLWVVTLGLSLLLLVAAIRVGYRATALAVAAAPLSGLLAALGAAASTGGVEQLTALSLFLAASGLGALGLVFLATVSPAAERPSAFAATRRLLDRGGQAPLQLLLVVVAAGLYVLPWPHQALWLLPLRSLAIALAVGVVVLPLATAACSGLALHHDSVRRASRTLRHLPPAWSSSAPPSLALRRLSVVYPDGHVALRRFSADIGPGVTALLGPNGAGKTSLLRILTGLLEPTTGRYSFKGVRVERDNRAAFLQHVGYLPQGHHGYGMVTGRRYLTYWARERLGGAAAEVDRVLAQTGLEHRADEPLGDYSGGMLRRIGLAQALLTQPQVLIADEPDVGLDLDSRSEVLRVIKALATDRVVLLATHRLAELPSLADHLVLLERGRSIFTGPTHGLAAATDGEVRLARVQPTELAPLERRYSVTARKTLERDVELRILAPPGTNPPGVPVEPTFEELYLLYVAAQRR